jgi:hypothetical protein
LSGGTLSAQSIRSDNGTSGELYGYGTVILSGAVSGYVGLVADGGALKVQGSCAGDKSYLQIASGATLELSGTAALVDFISNLGILKLDASSSCTGTVAGMSGQDTIDFADINPTTVGQPSYSGTSSGGTLTVTDGTHTANIALLGNYLASTFVASSDGHGGTSVIDPVASSSQTTVLTQSQHA